MASTRLTHISTRGCLTAWKRNPKDAVHPCREHLSVHDTSKGGTVAPRGHQEGRAEQEVVGCGGDVDEPGHGSRELCLVRSSGLSPTATRSDRGAKRTTNVMARYAPVSRQSRGLPATFLLRFPPAFARNR